MHRILHVPVHFQLMYKRHAKNLLLSKTVVHESHTAPLSHNSTFPRCDHLSLPWQFHLVHFSALREPFYNTSHPALPQPAHPPEIDLQILQVLHSPSHLQGQSLASLLFSLSPTLHIALDCRQIENHTDSILPPQPASKT